MEIINELTVECTTLCNDTWNINLEKPMNLDKLPFIEEYQIDKIFVNICDSEYISKYFIDMVYGNIKFDCYSFDRTNHKYLFCNICDKIINQNQEYYTCFNEMNDDSFDICIKCSLNDVSCKYLIGTKNMTLEKIDNITEMGSLLYWIPLVYDNDDGKILINLNPDCNNYRKLCLQCCDIYGFSGYFIINEPDITLNILLEKLKYITDNVLTITENNHIFGLTNKPRKTHSLITSPIKQLMNDFNMNILFHTTR